MTINPTTTRFYLARKVAAQLEDEIKAAMQISLQDGMPFHEIEACIHDLMDRSEAIGMDCLTSIYYEKQAMHNEMNGRLAQGMSPF